MQTLGDKIKELKGDMSLTELSKESGVHRSKLSRVCSGKQDPMLYEVSRIARALGVSADSLIGDTTAQDIVWGTTSNKMVKFLIEAEDRAALAESREREACARLREELIGGPRYAVEVLEDSVQDLMIMKLQLELENHRFSDLNQELNGIIREMRNELTSARKYHRRAVGAVKRFAADMGTHGEFTGLLKWLDWTLEVSGRENDSEKTNDDGRISDPAEAFAALMGFPDGAGDDGAGDDDMGLCPEGSGGQSKEGLADGVPGD